MDSLESEIVNVLKDLSNAPLVFLEIGYLHMPQPHTEDSVKNWIASNDVPLPHSKSKIFIDKHQRDFSTMDMLPMMPYPKSTLQLFERYMM